MGFLQVANCRHSQICSFSGELHLSPLHAVVQMRPSFNYLDKADDKIKTEAAAREAEGIVQLNFQYFQRSLWKYEYQEGNKNNTYCHRKTKKKMAKREEKPVKQTSWL